MSDQHAWGTLFSHTLSTVQKPAPSTDLVDWVNIGVDQILWTKCRFGRRCMPENAVLKDKFMGVSYAFMTRPWSFASPSL